MFFVELIKVTLLSTFNTEENVYGFGEWKKQYQTTNISKLPAGFILVKIISCPAIELLCCVGQSIWDWNGLFWTSGLIQGQVCLKQP